jgi:Helix-turn-helix domain
MRAYRFALDPTPGQVRDLERHAGAARFAYNWALARVKANIGQRQAERSYGRDGDDLTPVLGWNLPALRRAWNQAKGEVAPWWGECSKEAFNTGLDGVARALKNFGDSRSGKRPGPKVGFPGSKPAAGRHRRCGSPPARSGSSPTGTTSRCPGWGGSRHTNPPAHSPAVRRPAPPESSPPRCAARLGAGTARSPLNSPVPPRSRPGPMSGSGWTWCRPRPGPQRGDQPEAVRRPEWPGDAKRTWSQPEDRARLGRWL